MSFQRWLLNLLTVYFVTHYLISPFLKLILRSSNKCLVLLISKVEQSRYNQYPNVENILSIIGDQREKLSHLQAAGKSYNYLLIQSIKSSILIINIAIRLYVDDFAYVLKIFLKSLKLVKIYKDKGLDSEKAQEVISEINRDMAGIYIKLDEFGRTIYWSQTATRIFLFESGDVLGRNALGYYIPSIETQGKNLHNFVNELCNNPYSHLLNVNGEYR